MKSPYLIQRAKINEQEATLKKGIDRILQFDYMGSSEFEWGALPTSLKRIRKDLDCYILSTIQIDSQTVSIFFNNKTISKEEIKNLIGGLYERKFRLKEYCDFAKGCTFKRNNFWWDLDNDFMFWLHNPTFESRFKDLI